jgi:hypothetical protein
MMLLALTTLVAACGPSTVTPADVTPDPTTAQKIDGRYLMTFTVDRTTLRTGDNITGSASLGLIAGGSGAFSGPSSTFVFSFVEVGGQNRAITPAIDADCSPHQIGNDTPLTEAMYKAGGADSAFATEFLRGDDIHLPAGEWDITATTDFFDGRSCTGQRHMINLTIRVHVR